ncbi:MAG: hypothetical protein D6767_09355 [Candidatus Hydrogenedentota bacterium]|nr:MAG: hypothetical protein D6767_09355 [Candidatus Hydrogenedentota bacterium]
MKLVPMVLLVGSIVTQTFANEISFVSFQKGVVQFQSSNFPVTIQSLKARVEAQSSSVTIAFYSEADFIEIRYHGKLIAFLCWGKEDKLDYDLQMKFREALAEASSLWNESCITTSGSFSANSIKLRPEYRGALPHARFHYTVQFNRGSYTVTNAYKEIPKTLTLENINQFYPNPAELLILDENDRKVVVHRWRDLPPGIYILLTTPARVFWRAK